MDGNVGDRIDGKNDVSINKAEETEDLSFKGMIVGKTWYETVLNFVGFLIAMVVVFCSISFGGILEWRTNKLKAFLDAVYLLIFAYLLFCLIWN